MSVVYPSDYPKTIHEAIEAARSVNEEDVDYSDIPEPTDEELEQFRPVEDRFVEIAKKNAVFLNRLLKDYYAKKGIAL